MSFERERPPFRLSDDPALLDVAGIHDFVANRSYWGRGRPREVVERAIAGSLCFGVYRPPQPVDGAGDAGAAPRQVAFARVVTDRATFAWLCDVYVLESERGHGLGKWLVASLLEHPDLQRLRRFLLATADAHGLYAQHGWKPLAAPERWMERFDPQPYGS